MRQNLWRRCLLAVLALVAMAVPAVNAAAIQPAQARTTVHLPAAQVHQAAKHRRLHCPHGRVCYWQYVLGGGQDLQVKGPINDWRKIPHDRQGSTRNYLAHDPIWMYSKSMNIWQCVPPGKLKSNIQTYGYALVGSVHSCKKWARPPKPGCTGPGGCPHLTHWQLVAVRLP